jgi:hypothetical protein
MNTSNRTAHSFSFQPALFVMAAIVAVVLLTPRAYGQDHGVLQPSDTEPSCVFYDSCTWDSGGTSFARGMTSCSTYDRCLECGTDAFTNKKSCFYVWRSASCECTTSESFDPGINQNVIHCSATGTCTHRG